ncbi:ribonuclease R [Perlabentimonas gracilis]|uniref:ribonuclease R n=1 Tax=Perlabentimonas gracilis TaxID=2715279 RepID=UPI001408CB4F|nr:ribonuclease R [Perlabentimonas gracilis]NHB69050.1 ribonuclease R [Perlabentimonas gracilis]
MAKKQKAKKGEGFNKNMLMKSIMGIYSSDPSQSLNYKQIAKILEAKDPTSKRLINEVLYELAEQGALREVYKGKFMVKMLSVAIEGVVEMESDGNAYVITTDNQEVFVPEYNLNHALHGDRVKVAISPKRRRQRMEAEVVEVMERAKRTFVGKIEVEANYAFVITDNKLMPYDIFIPKGATNNAKNGQKVIARITDWPRHTKNPMGEVVEVIGDPGVHEVEMHSILAEFELPYHFPEELNTLAEKISDKISKQDIAARRDFRDIPTFTIDPADAKDFDDALSIRKIDENIYEIGVHIADVTHYVTPGSPIDSEAIERATSVYLVDRCVPMLPERLSNFICSLRPNEEKLCFSAVFEMDMDGNVQKEWFGRTVILSQLRMAYEEAQQVIETGEGEMFNEILTLNSIAQKLRYNRLKAGAVNFDRAEVKFELDDNGKPLGVYFKVQKEANQLIEEFMLLANRKVAEYVGAARENYKVKPFVYRIHDKPNPEKFENFRSFVTRFGYNVMGGTDRQISRSLNKLLKEVKGKKEQNLIETLALRSMAKARYSANNIGHYGLGFPHYTHFTSPIRRYPDMMVHRLLAHYLDGGKPKNEDELERLCKHSTDMEIKATDAERASIKYKQVEFMSDKIGLHFQGVITGVTSFGLFVELNETKCEGLVAIRDLDDDYYEFDEENYCLVGRQTDKKFQLGDELLVEVWRTNLPKKQLDFKLIDEEGKTSGKTVPQNRSRTQGASNTRRKSNPDKTRKHKGVQRKRR